MVRGRRLRVFLALEEVRLGRPFRARVGWLCQPRAMPWATMGCPVGTTGRGTVTQAPWNDEIIRLALPVWRYGHGTGISAATSGQNFKTSASRVCSLSSSSAGYDGLFRGPAGRGTHLITL